MFNTTDRHIETLDTVLRQINYVRRYSNPGIGNRVRGSEQSDPADVQRDRTSGTSAHRGLVHERK